MSIDIKSFDFVLNKITDGFLFEKFAQALLCQIVGVNFIPIGGIKDRGIDGLDHTWQQKDGPKTVYQISIEADSRSKIRKSIETLKSNGIVFERFFYVTNRQIKEQDKLMEEVYRTHSVILVCRDIAWLRGNVSNTEATLRVYAEFFGNNVHQIAPATPFVVADFSGDSRIFVFLRQQFDDQRGDSNLRELLVDSLILYGLEGTNPDKGILRTKEEIVAQIIKVIKFPLNQIEGLIDGRLKHLSNKPKKINYHKTTSSYCLPFETRLKIDEQHARDQELCENFNETTSKQLDEYLSIQKVSIKGALELLLQVLKNIFKKQGLDFTDFVLHQKDPKTIEHTLHDIIINVLENSRVPPTLREGVYMALHGTIRQIIYRGTAEQLEYLQKLSKTYQLLFLVQCEPRVCEYFDSLAAKLKVFVCNSILVPALSEFCLPAENRRHWNLLLQARNAGVSLFVNKVTLEELLSHIRLSLQRYEVEYAGLEEMYSDELTLKYVESILIRAYLYQKAHGDSLTFDQFINKFVSPRARPVIMHQEMISFLKDEFGIQYIDDPSLGVQIDAKQISALASELEKYKQTKQQAENDARTILGIYALRVKNNEVGTAGIFGCQTWWLSKDTTTHRAVRLCFKDKQFVSCYLRPDFLLNYIALSARSGHATKVFDQMFPTLIGVTLSHHVTTELSQGIHEAIKAHSELSAARVKAVIGSMSTRLMTDGNLKGKQLKHILDEAFEKETGAINRVAKPNTIRGESGKVPGTERGG